MPSFWKIVNNVIERADVLLLVLDSRFPELTRNKEIEQKIKYSKKKMIYVYNKVDLTPNLIPKLKPFAKISTIKRYGGVALYKKILEIGKGKCTVGVLGYPNVGKSSVINLIKGHKSASVSPQAGHTRGMQFVKKGRVRFMDTPGVLEYKEKDIFKQVIVGAKNPEHLKQPEYFALKLIEEYRESIERHYNHHNEDEYDFLEELAKKMNFLSKGAIPDVQRCARKILMDWQRGKIKIIV